MSPSAHVAPTTLPLPRYDASRLSHEVLSSILRHERKQTTYKIALLRALNVVALAYPDPANRIQDVAVPLDRIAEQWIAYYWPFMDRMGPIQQGYGSMRDGGRKDVAFRVELTELRRAWEEDHGLGLSAGDGFLVVDQMRTKRKRDSLSLRIRDAFDRTRTKVAHAIQQPVRYAGTGEHEIFTPPRRFSDMSNVAALPRTEPQSVCLRVPRVIWNDLRDLSLWVEALCLHEWSLTTERFDGGVDRGSAYKLLTAHQELSEARLPTTWERNRIDLLFLEGFEFICPWTSKRLAKASYHLDHVVPVSVYPLHELWNLVPSDPRFNMHGKSDRLPSTEKMRKGQGPIVNTFSNYRSGDDLRSAFDEDVRSRFSVESSPERVAHALVELVHAIGESRNLVRF